MTVHFIGAGPGAPDLITVRGLRLIRRCPVVLYAGSLVPAEVIAEAGEDTAAKPRVIDTAPLELQAIVGEMAAALALVGAFASIYHPVGIPMLVQHAVRPGWTIGVNGLAGNLGIAAAALVTGLLVKYFGWRAAFAVPGLVAIGCGVLFAMVAPRELEAPARRKSKRLEVPPSVLARVFAVSRPSLREALGALQMLGVVETHHGSGTWVAENALDVLATRPAADALDFGVSPVALLEARADA